MSTLPVCNISAARVLQDLNRKFDLQGSKAGSAFVSAWPRLIFFINELLIDPYDRAYIPYAIFFKQGAFASRCVEMIWTSGC